MIDQNHFNTLLSKYAGGQSVSPADVLFGGGLDISSIGFTEFIMELEETCGLDIDLDRLDESIKTVGQLYNRLSELT
jgi:acyl carrier protein